MMNISTRFRCPHKVDGSSLMRAEPPSVTAGRLDVAWCWHGRQPHDDHLPPLLDWYWA